MLGIGPFVQGQLRQESLTFSIETECAHCGRPLHIEMDSTLSQGVYITPIVQGGIFGFPRRSSCCAV